MTKSPRQPPSKRQRALTAALFGLLFGGLAGALVGASLTGRSGAIVGAVVGALALACGEGITDWQRPQGGTKPQAYRLVATTFMWAAVGGLLALLAPELNPLLVALLIGLLDGLFALQVRNVLLAAAVGLVAGLFATFVWPTMPFALLAGLVVFIYHALAAVLFSGPEPLALTAERVPAAEIRYVVPFEANSAYVGVDFFKQYALLHEAAFERNAPGIGLVESLDVLRGPTFDPALVDPRVRDFYEHTSNYRLDIIPEWRTRVKPLFWLYKRLIAQPIGQANLPFNTEEAQRGVVSYIDSIDLSGDAIVDLRAWVRAFEATGEAIYVGAYTTLRHEDRGYISVGFPLPGAGFTATLLPYNHNGRYFLLKTRDTGLPYPGHYLTFREGDDLTVLELPTLGEEIEVYVQDGRLRTDHRFYLANLLFLTLYYTIEPKSGSASLL